MMNPQPRYLSIFASYRKQILIGLGIGAACALVVFAALFFIGETSVTAMSLSGDALLGSDVQMNVTVHNAGLLPAKYSAVLLADGEKAASQEISLAPGEQQTVKIPVSGLSLGAHTIEAGGAKADIKVLKPASYTVKSLDIEPKDVKPGDDVTVTAVIDNSGDVQGNFVSALLLDQQNAATVSAQIGPGGEQTVTSTLKAVARGSHTVGLGSASSQFKALAPAEIQLRSFSLASTYAQPGQAVDATVILENIGDADGTYHLKIMSGDAVYSEQDVAVSASATETVHVNVSGDKAGSYVFIVGDQRRMLQIVQITRPKTGSLLVKKANGGVCYITVENGYPVDMVLTLVSSSNPTTPVLMVYVRAGEKSGKIKVKNGTYLIYYTYGTDMDSASRRFIGDPNYGVFDDTLTLKTYKTYSWYYVTTHYVYYEFVFGKPGSNADTYSHSIISNEYPD